MAETAAVSGKATELEAAVRELMRSRSIPISPYPGVAMRLQKLVSTQSFGTQDLVKIAGAEPVVVSQLLRSANASAFAGTGRTTSLAGAVARLGGAEVVRIAIAACLGADAGRRGPLAALRRTMWQEAITGALLCTQIAHARGLDKDTSFVCGLLHDIGRVAAAGALEQVLERKRDDRPLPEAVWLGIIDRLHVEVGLSVAAHWALPPEVQSAIANHHQPPGADPHEPLIEVVRAADHVVKLMMSHAQLTDAQLAAGRLLSPPEIALVLDAIPKIGPLVAGLADLPTTGAEARSQVERPVTPPAPALEIRFPLTVVRSEKSVTGTCTGVAWSSLAANLKQALVESYLCKLRLEPQGVPAFEVHARVLSCAPVTGGYNVEVQLFALGGAAKDTWQKLVRSLGQPAPAAATA
jgi:putative nucleotidyltransferase with HDIG domain